MAERGRWTDAVRQYHLAIDGETRDLDRRVWWFNLADLAGKTGDLDARNQAIENAKGTDLSDEVTQRAANAHRLNPESTKLERPESMTVRTCAVEFKTATDEHGEITDGE